jgi:hypothetical protein
VIKVGHNLKIILEKCYEFGIELHNIFIDIKQAFDKVNRPKIYESLKVLKIPKPQSAENFKASKC